MSSVATGIAQLVPVLSVHVLQYTAAQQVQAMEGGTCISSVIHGARTLLELRPTFVAVALDMINGYPTIKRAARLTSYFARRRYERSSHPI